MFEDCDLRRYPCGAEEDVLAMGKKKFIDKKRATTYSLVFRSAEDGVDAGPVRQLVDASKPIGVGGRLSGTSRYPPGHPLSFLEDAQV